MCLQEHRERAEFAHLKGRAKAGAATLPNEPPAPAGRGQGGFPMAPLAGLAALGKPARCARSSARPRTQDGCCSWVLEIQRAMPQKVEAEAGQLEKKPGQRRGEPDTKQGLTFLEGRQLRGIGACHRCQRQGLGSASALDHDFGVLCR